MKKYLVVVEETGTGFCAEVPEPKTYPVFCEVAA